ncbi:glycoside hydrolase [Mycena alexandri]|uniref:Glycoside hydrolase n=1 Tax=Mycena alexandri TaxID=1745969 RepID=A0AAD6THE2_9AGAR|nr:glycoside hydrolase [Mycena alexandri]
MLPWNFIAGALKVFVLLRTVAGGSVDKQNQTSEANSCNGTKIVVQDRPVESFPLFDRPTSTIMRYRSQRAVNLGSWFVHEQWMTPSLFINAAGAKLSELDIASGGDSPNCARQMLEDHWKTFITAKDFSDLASKGINTVRLPIGYWSLGPEFCQGTPFSPFADVYHNSWSFIVQAIKMAADFEIGVLVDLHGAVGSQNGQPHSGISNKHAGLFDSETNMDKTIDVLTFLTEKLCNVTNVIGIQVLNEPQDDPGLIDFYIRAISEMRRVPGAESFPIYIHDAFNLEKFSDFVSQRSDFIVQDHHSYFVFTSQDEKKSASQHTEDIRTSILRSLFSASKNERGNLIVGEWSCALTPESLSMESDQVAAREKFCKAQLDVYSSATAGWSFWSYKKEDCDNGWCFTAALGTALPPDFFSYRQSCDSLGSNGGLINLRSFDAFAPNMTQDLDMKRSTTPFHHRLATIHYYRLRRLDTDSNMTAEEQSETKGYEDGFLTAKQFCEHDGSRLGFIGQFIDDSIKALGPTVVQSGTEPDYIAGFTRGLSDGEGSS